MTPLRRFAVGIAPFFILGACAQLIGLSDYEHGEGDAGEGGEETGGRGARGGASGSSSGGTATGGTSGKGSGGTGTGGRGGTTSDPGGEGGVGGEAGDEGGAGQGGSRGGSGGAGAGAGGKGGKGGGAGAGAGGGGAGTGGAGAGGAGTGGAGAGGAGTGGGGAGNAGGGTGGSAGTGNCTTVTVPISSPGFDQDNALWLTYDNGMGPNEPRIASAASLGITAQSAPNVAYLGGLNSLVEEGQFQTITIPAGAVTMTLSGHRQVISEEGTSAIYDRMYIQMYEDALTATGFLGTFVTINNTMPSTGWVAFTGSMAVGTHAGQMVDLDMWATTDSSLVTSFYIDSLTLTAFVCP